MDIQQLAALAIVLVAVVYLSRSLITSARGFFDNRGGCGGGCGKCPSAQKSVPMQTALGAQERSTRIALSDIRILPTKRSANGAGQAALQEKTGHGQEVG